MREEGQHRVHIITKVRSLWTDRVIWYECVLPYAGITRFK